MEQNTKNKTGTFFNTDKDVIDSIDKSFEGDKFKVALKGLYDIYREDGNNPSESYERVLKVAIGEDS